MYYQHVFNTTGYSIIPSGQGPIDAYLDAQRKQTNMASGDISQDLSAFSLLSQFEEVGSDADSSSHHGQASENVNIIRNRRNADPFPEVQPVQAPVIAPVEPAAPLPRVVVAPAVAIAPLAAPEAPVLPAVTVAPVAPVAPVVPSLPVVPALPAVPAAPVVPVAPVAPEAEVGKLGVGKKGLVDWDSVKKVMFGFLICAVWRGSTPSEFLGTANIECSAQPESCNMSDTLSASQYQADLWDLRQAHDVCLFEKTDCEQFKIRVFQAVAVMMLLIILCTP